MASSTTDNQIIIVIEASPEKPTTTVAAKKRGLLSFIRATLFIVRSKFSGKSSVETNAGRGELWRSLICGMRHLNFQQQTDEFPMTPHPQPLESFHNVQLPLCHPQPLDSFHNVQLPPPSPDSMSRYVSAEDLQALDAKEGNGGEAEGEVEGDGDGDGDSVEIDLKAEEFIAKFYEQMRLQRLDLVAEENE